MIEFLLNNWGTILLIAVIIFVVVEIVVKMRKKISLTRRISLYFRYKFRQYLNIFLIEIIVVCIVITVIASISARYDKSIWDSLRQVSGSTMPNESHPDTNGIPFGVFLSIFAAILTTLGAVLSFKVWRQLSGQLHSVDQLLKEVNKYLLQIGGMDPSDVEYLKLPLYMYLKTPSLGNVSASRSQYNNFHENLIGAKTNKGADVKIICLPKSQYDGFHKRLFASRLPRGQSLKSQQQKKVSEWNKKAEDLHDKLNNSIKEHSKIFNGFFVVTDTVAYQFSIKAREGNGHNDIVGRVIKNPNDVKFIRDSFIQSWNET
ncbi:hypothetical protein H8D57_00610 [bacterium]|nr:hypothetical protein [bacterium]